MRMFQLVSGVRLSRPRRELYSQHRDKRNFLTKISKQQRRILPFEIFLIVPLSLIISKTTKDLIFRNVT